MSRRALYFFILILTALLSGWFLEVKIAEAEKEIRAVTPPKVITPSRRPSCGSTIPGVCMPDRTVLHAS